jgi:diguanylate cyclase (GGDEF)-like protein
VLRREDVEHLCMHNLLTKTDERLFFKDLDSRFLVVSRGWLGAYAGDRGLEEVVGKSDFDFFSDEHANQAYADEQRIIGTGEEIVGKVERETYHDRPDAWVSTTKLLLQDDEGLVVGTFGISRDVTAQVSAEQALAHQALHDPVTRLPNRLALMDRLSQALLSLDRSGKRVALLLVDLDNFKAVNDMFGHEAGDRVLVEAGRRLQLISRCGDTVARFGGDELVLLCSELRDDDEVRMIAARAVLAIGERFVDGGDDLTVTGSIGVVVTGDPWASPGEMLQQAEASMYAAKSAGRNNFKLFDGKVRTLSLASHEFDSALRRAVEEEQLFLVYQPLFSLRDRSMSGVEALVRWEHPERGTVPPGDFIPLAEERGLIRTIDAFVLDEACRQLAQWKREGHCKDGFTVSVNLSGREFSDPTIVERVTATIERHGIAPSQLCLEVTETAAVGELGGVAASLAALSGTGALIALDDFGTGYSTLAHLQRLNADVLKIDRSFVEHIGRSDRDRAIVSATTAMAHALGMSVVGEGIETDSQLEGLAAMGCDVGQGYLLARPLPADKLVALRRGEASAGGSRNG